MFLHTPALAVGVIILFMLLLKGGTKKNNAVTEPVIPTSRGLHAQAAGLFCGHGLG